MHTETMVKVLKNEPLFGERVESDRDNISESDALPIGDEETELQEQEVTYEETDDEAGKFKIAIFIHKDKNGKQKHNLYCAVMAIILLSIELLCNIFVVFHVI